MRRRASALVVAMALAAASNGGRSPPVAGGARRGSAPHRRSQEGGGVPRSPTCSTICVRVCCRPSSALRPDCPPRKTTATQKIPHRARASLRQPVLRRREDETRRVALYLGDHDLRRDHAVSHAGASAGHDVDAHSSQGPREPHLAALWGGRACRRQPRNSKRQRERFTATS